MIHMSRKKRTDNGIVYSTDPDFALPVEDELHTELLSPSRQPLRVRRDAKHRGGKTVTLVEGFAGPGVELEKLGKQLKNHCGVGGSIKDGQVILQGDHREKVLLWLKKNGYSNAT